MIKISAARAHGGWNYNNIQPLNTHVSNVTGEARSNRRFRLCGRWLVCVALIILSVGFLWKKSRSRSEWDRYQEELAAKGEHLDWKYFIPPPVKDEENFYAAPGMKEMFQQEPQTMEEMLVSQPSTSLPWRLPEKEINWGDLKAKELFIESPDGINYPVPVVLLWEKENQKLIQSVLNAVKRPQARLVEYQAPFEHARPNWVNYRMAVQTMTTIAKAHIVLGHPEEAMPYMDGIYRLMTGLEQNPTLSDALMNVAFAHLYSDLVQFGLERNAWTEEQLRTLQQNLSQKTCLPAVGFGFRQERASTLELVQRLPFRRVHPRFKMYTLPYTPPTMRQSISETLQVMWLGLRFGSAHEKNLLNFAHLFQEGLQCMDARAERVYPARCVVFESHLVAAQTNESSENILVTMALPTFRRALEVASKNQTLVNEGAVACALELYRRAEGRYPSALGELIPRFLTQLPHDIIGGGPLHYERKAPDQFLLYSVGWNETDDKGSTTNDWVWGTPPL